MKKFIVFLIVLVAVFASFNHVDATNEPLYEFYIIEAESGEKSFPTKADFDIYYDSEFSEVAFELYVRSLSGSDLDLSSFQFDINLESPLGMIGFAESVTSGRNDVWNFSSDSDITVLAMYHNLNELNATVSP